MRERGVVTRAKGESILFAPPLVITEEQIDRDRKRHALKLSTP